MQYWSDSIPCSDKMRCNLDAQFEESPVTFDTANAMSESRSHERSLDKIMICVKNCDSYEMN